MNQAQKEAYLREYSVLKNEGKPFFPYAVTKDGRYAGSSAYEGGTFAVADASGPRIEPAVYLYKREDRPKAR